MTLQTELPLLPTIDDVTRRAFISTAMLAAFAVACGSDDEPPVSTLQATNRTIMDRYGAVEVPANPQRVVTLERVTLFHCLALGIQPLATTLTGSRTLAELQPDWLETRPRADIQILDEANPDIEAVARLQPDLMVTYLEHKNIDKLRQIAPVVAPAYRGSPDWRNLFAGIAQALNREAEAAAFVKRYEDRVARFKQETLPRMQGKTVSAIRVRPNGVRIEVLNSFPGQVFTDAGVARPANQQVTTELGYVEVSVELLKDADADYLFVIVVDNAEEVEAIRNLQSNPLFSSLKAQQTGHVHVVDNPTWFGGLHYLAAERMLDELAEFVTA